ncbi:MAG: hypothetical protein ABMA14_25175 [Hyphomonadaceae bacterium]
MIAPNWSDPLAMFIAWLVRIFEQITKLRSVRHTTRFKSNWRDHWANLRQLEWMREQILGDCARRLLAGETLDAESNFIPTTDPPADYGGPCPRTPFDMNRRFLAIARFNADPEAAILEHVRRIAKRESIDLSNPLAAQVSTDAMHCAAAHHEAGGPCEAQTLLPLMVSSAPCARPSNHEGQQRAPPGATGCARGPPQTPQIQHFPTRAYPRERGRLCVLDAPPPQPYLAPVCTATRSSRRAPSGGAS